MKKTKRIFSLLLAMLLFLQVGMQERIVTQASTTAEDYKVAIAAKAKTYGEYTRQSFINEGFTDIASAWCVWFVRHCANQVGAGSIFSTSNLTTTFYEEMTNPNGAYKATGVYFNEGKITNFDCFKYATAVDRSTYVPQAGDIVCIIWNGTSYSSIGHVGLVTGYDASTKKVSFVDGNTRSSTSESLRVKVRDGNNYEKFSASNAQIIGYIRPNYESLASSAGGVTTESYQSTIAAKAKTYGEYTRTSFLNAGFSDIPEAWCVWFIRHCAEQVGAGSIFSTSNLTTTFYEEMTNPNGAYKATGVYFNEGKITNFDCFKYASQVDRSTYTPQAGDVICLNWNGEGATSIGHMGIVTGYNASTQKIAFVDGNVRSTSAENFRVKVRDGNSYELFGAMTNLQIVGYIRPNYDALTTPTDTTPPDISDIKIQKDSLGYTISCVATDDVQVAAVKFPTWTSYNDQDDLAAVFPDGTYNNGRWEYRVNISEHNGESGEYITHIYAYDTSGNWSIVGYVCEVYPLKGIALSASEKSLKKGEEFALTVSYNPTNTTDSKDVTWQTSDKNVATVKDGTVKAVGAGTATITAKVGAFSASCKVTVVQQVEKITLSQSSLSLTEKGTATLKAEVSPDNAQNKAVAWSSSDKAVATVDANGKVTAVAAGTATITATAQDGSKISGSCTVVVTKPEPTVTPTPSVSPELMEFVIAENGVLTGYNGEGGEVVIPSGVTEIGKEAFKDCSNLTEITIPDGVTKIGKKAFYSCGSLTEVIISESVTSIGEEAFGYCTSLQEINIPEGITSIERAILAGCESLKEISLPENLTSIGDYAFDGCQGLTELIIPEGVTWIGEGAIEGCSGLTEIVIPESVTVINLYTFRFCSGLTKITLPSGVTDIKAGAFGGCSSLTTIVLPDGITVIRDCMFGECYSLTELTIPKSVTNIEAMAFFGCGNLTKLIIPTGVTSIGEMAFLGCRNFTIYGYPNSTAEKYAQENNIPFVVLDYKCGDFAYIVTNETDKTCTITQYTGTDKKLEIPEKLDDYTVTAIGEAVFMNDTALESIILPQGITRIEMHAFKGCINLTDITIPEGVTAIEGAAFAECMKLPHIVIPESIESIGASAFSGCRSLTEINIPERVTGIGAYAFENCSSLRSVKMHEGLSSIEDDAFKGCWDLTRITIPKSVTDIGIDAFENNSSMYFIMCVYSNTSAEKYAKNNGIKFLTLNGTGMSESEENKDFIVDKNGALIAYVGDGGKLELPKVTAINNNAFYGCNTVTEVVIPEGVTAIGASAFAGCSSLEAIAMPDGVAEIGASAFADCVSLKEITIPKAVTVIEDDLFEGCENLEVVTIPEGVTSIGSRSFMDCNKLRKITIPESVTTIWNNAFEGCGNIARMTIPSSVTSIGTSAFSWMGGYFILCGYADSYVETYAQNNSINFVALDSKEIDSKGFLIDENGVLVTYVGTEEAVIIPEGVTAIGKGAFAGCGTLKKVTIPKSVTSIGANAFKRCVQLSEINIPESVTSIGDSAFSFCTGLESIKIPGSVTTIGSYVFYGCTNLKELELENGVTSIGMLAFYECKSLEEVVIPQSVTSLNGFQLFMHCSSLKSVTIPSNLTECVGVDTFAYCNSLTAITLPEGTKYIGNGAFSGCKSLQEIVIPEGVTSIGMVAFYECSSLTSVVIPESVTRIESTAFTYCNSLSSVVIPDGVTYIGTSAFRYCSGLSEITIPKSVTEIGTWAFEYVAKDFTIYGYKDSYAQDYAHNYNFNFVELEDKEEEEVKPEKYEGLKYVVTENGITISGYTDELTGDIVIPSAINGEKVTTIGGEAFSDCTKLTSISIPKDITYIGINAFRGCSNLTTVLMADGIATIDDYAFYNCASIKCIKIPASVTTIGQYALGYQYKAEDTNEIYPDFRIEGYEGSIAQAYANVNGIEFVLCKDSYTGLKLEDGKWIYVVDDVKDTSKTGLVQFDGAWFYVQDGELDTKLLGYVEYDNNLFYVAAGQVVTSANGLVQDGEKWYYVARGQVQKQYTGLAQYDGEWFYIDEGDLDTKLNAYVEYDGGLFYVSAGRIMQEVNGLVQDPTNRRDWYFCANGQVQKQYSGLAKYDGAWFYVVEGRLQSDYTGYMEYDGGTFYVQNGQLRNEIA